VSIAFTSELPGISRTTEVVFSDPNPSAFEVRASQSKIMDLLRRLVVFVMVGGTLVIIGLRIRARRLRTRRLMRRSPFQR
jgi:hypothetical protein